MRRQSDLRNFAQALFEAAGSKKSREQCFEELTAVSEWILSDERSLCFFETPSVPTAEKTALMLKIFKPGKMVLGFLDLLIKRKLIGKIALITAYFKEFIDSAAHIETVDVMSSYVLAKDQKELIKARLESVLNRTIEPVFAVDPAIMAGLVIKYGDMIVDASLKNEFSALRRELVR